MKTDVVRLEKSFRVVLVGGGHSNVLVLKALWERKQELGLFEVYLISDSKMACYSGMLPAVVAGLMKPKQALLDLPHLCAMYHAHFIEASFEGLECTDISDLIVLSTKGAKCLVAFDLAVINIGATVRGFHEIPGVANIAVTTRPINQLIDKLEYREKLWMLEQAQLNVKPSSSKSRVIQICVIGSGFAGIELACCLHSRYQASPVFQNQRFPCIKVLSATDLILPCESSILRRNVLNIFQAKGIEVISNARVTQITPTYVSIEHNQGKQTIRSDLTIWATGPAPHPCLSSFEMCELLDIEGYLKVEPTLQLLRHPHVFAAGDCVSFPSACGVPIEKSGVYSIREAPIITDNICSILKHWRPSRNEPSSINDLLKQSSRLRPLCSQLRLRRYLPQPSYLALLCVGDGTAVSRWHSFSFHNRSMWILKRWIDIKFMWQLKNPLGFEKKLRKALLFCSFSFLAVLVIFFIFVILNETIC